MRSDPAHSIVQLVRALSAPVLLEEQTLIKFAQIFRRKLGGTAFNGAELHAELGIAARGNGNRGQASGAPRIAVIPVQGVLAQHPQSLGTSTDEIDQDISAALADPRIDGILLDMDSPGGTVPGIPELGAKILAGRAVKPIVALANGLAASAAYWLASAAHEIIVTPSGEVGSIGVYMLHEDWSRNLDQEGVAITAISAGKYKTEGAPWAPLSAEAEANMRERVDEVYGWFVRAVAMGRKAESQKAVREVYGQGRVLGAAQAVKANLADRIGTFDDAVARVAARVERAVGSQAGPSASLLRRRLELGGSV